MKKIAALLLMLTLLPACKGSNDSAAGATGGKVGTILNGETEIIDAESIKINWENVVKKANPDVELLGFEIIKGVTGGESQEDYYMMLARTDDGHLKAAALLEPADNALYYAYTSHSDGVVPLTICQGPCDTGCVPEVIVKGGVKMISCTACVDCTKKEMEMR